MSDCHTSLSESETFHVALLSANKEKSRTAALNKDMHRNQNEIRTCQLCKTIFSLSASSNLWFVYFVLGCNKLPTLRISFTGIVLALIINCTAMLLLQVWELYKNQVHLILRGLLMVANIVKISKPQTMICCLTVKLNLGRYQNITLKP